MPIPHIFLTCAGVAVSSVIVYKRLTQGKRDDEASPASTACSGCNSAFPSSSHRSHESPRAPGILPERPVGTFSRRQAASLAEPSAPTRSERLLRLQASTVLQTTKYIQLLSCILVCLSSAVIVHRSDLAVSLLPVLGLLLLNVAALELAVRRPALARLPSAMPSPPAETEEQKPGPVLHPVMPHVHMLPYRSEDISGLWIKDRRRSDSMGPACDLMQMNGLVRKAVVLMKGVQISLTDERFTVSVVSVIPLLKITESYHVNGQMTQHKRRDLRRGKHFGRIEVTSAGIVLIVRWDEPLAGYGSEVFRLVSPTELHVESQMRVGRNEVKYTAIYNKRS